jgi:hypothetical protein
MTLRDVGQGLRKDMLRRQKALEEVGRIKYGEKPGNGPGIPGVVLEVSNVGPVKIKRPIEDIWIELHLKRELTGEAIALMGYSVVGEKKNDLILTLRYGDGKVSDEKAMEIAKLIRHMVTKVSLDRTVKSVFDELRGITGGKQTLR